MYPSPFDYARPATLDEAVALLQQHGEDAKLLAGGHSLLPLMKLRLAAPAMLIDLGRIPDLAGVQAADGKVQLGAMTTYAAIMDSAELARACLLLPEVAGLVGDMQVRNRGTVGGAAAHADPAGDMPAALLALDATFTAQGPRGERSIRAEDFFQGIFTTALQPEEVLTGITIDVIPARTGMAYEKFRNPASGYAIVGIAAVVTLDDTIREIHVAITGAGSQPTRATAVENALRGQRPDASLSSDAAQLITDGLDIVGDIHASSGYRSHLARVLARRALDEALQRAQM